MPESDPATESPTTAETSNDAQPSHDSPYNAHLVSRRDVHDKLAIFTVALDAGPVDAFEPGQYTTLGLIERDENGEPVMGRRGPKLLRRAYSIASPPRNAEQLSFYIVRVDDGSLTPHLWDDIDPGDPLFMDARVKGTFTLEHVPQDQDNKRDLVFIATGTGLGPFIAMLHEHLPKPASERPWNRLVIMDGNRYAQDLAYLDELTAIAEREDTITYLPSVTRELHDSPWAGLRGRVTDLIQPDRFQELCGFELSPETCQVFLCGNPAMIDQVEIDLQARGFTVHDRKNPDGTIHYERYW